MLQAAPCAHLRAPRGGAHMRARTRRLHLQGGEWRQSGMEGGAEGFVGTGAAGAAATSLVAPTGGATV